MYNWQTVFGVQIHHKVYKYTINEILKKSRNVLQDEGKLKFVKKVTADYKPQKHKFA